MLFSHVTVLVSVDRLELFSNYIVATEYMPLKFSFYTSFYTVYQMSASLSYNFLFTTFQTYEK